MPFTQTAAAKGLSSPPMEKWQRKSRGLGESQDNNSGNSQPPQHTTEPVKTATSGADSADYFTNPPTALTEPEWVTARCLYCCDEKHSLLECPEFPADAILVFSQCRVFAIEVGEGKLRREKTLCPTAFLGAPSSQSIHVRAGHQLQIPPARAALKTRRRQAEHQDEPSADDELSLFTILDIKTALANVCHIRTEDQILQFGSQLVQDDETLHSLGIGPRSVLLLRIRCHIFAVAATSPTPTMSRCFPLQQVFPDDILCCEPCKWLIAKKNTVATLHYVAYQWVSYCCTDPEAVPGCWPKNVAHDFAVTLQRGADILRQSVSLPNLPQFISQGPVASSRACCSTE